MPSLFDLLILPLIPIPTDTSRFKHLTLSSSKSFLPLESFPHSVISTRSLGRTPMRNRLDYRPELDQASFHPFDLPPKLVPVLNLNRNYSLRFDPSALPVTQSIIHGKDKDDHTRSREKANSTRESLRLPIMALPGRTTVRKDGENVYRRGSSGLDKGHFSKMNHSTVSLPPASRVDHWPSISTLIMPTIPSGLVGDPDLSKGTSSAHRRGATRALSDPPSIEYSSDHQCEMDHQTYPLPLRMRAKSMTNTIPLPIPRIITPSSQYSKQDIHRCDNPEAPSRPPKSPDRGMVPLRPGTDRGFTNMTGTTEGDGVRVPSVLASEVPTEDFVDDSSEMVSLDAALRCVYFTSPPAVSDIEFTVCQSAKSTARRSSLLASQSVLRGTPR